MAGGDQQIAGGTGKSTDITAIDRMTDQESLKAILFHMFPQLLNALFHPTIPLNVVIR